MEKRTENTELISVISKLTKWWLSHWSVCDGCRSPLLLASTSCFTRSRSPNRLLGHSFTRSRSSVSGSSLSQLGPERLPEPAASYSWTEPAHKLVLWIKCYTQLHTREGKGKIPPWPSGSSVARLVLVILHLFIEYIFNLTLVQHFCCRLSTISVCEWFIRMKKSTLHKINGK